MAIDFPASPSVNDTYTFSNRTWLWNGSGWVSVVLGGWKLAAENQPISDVATVVFTGLSIYQMILVIWTVQISDAAQFNISFWAAAGTYRDFSISTPSTTDDIVFGVALISNFGIAASHKVLMTMGAAAAGPMDASNASNGETAGTGLSYASYAEIWDDIKLWPASGTIEGSTADQRGRISVYGMLK